MSSPAPQRELDLLLVGPYPPPLGGVSSHVRQVAEATAAAGYRIGVLDHFGGERTAPPVLAGLRRNPARYLLELGRRRAEVVHVHYAGRTSILFAAAAAAARRRRPDERWLLTIHNHSLTPVLGSRLQGHFARTALRQFDEIIAVSGEVRDAVARHLPGKPVVTVPAYIGLGARGGELLEPATSAFLGGPGVTLVVSAYRVRTLRGGGDVYGLDVAARAFLELAAELPTLKLALFLAHPPRGWRAKRYLARIRAQLDRDWPGRTRVAVGQPLVPSFGRRTVYLRPTRTDGDAVSVREALARHVPVIASDAASRPRGVRVVPLTDAGAWVVEVRRAVMALAFMDGLPSSPPAGPGGADGSLSAMLALYRRHLDRPSHDLELARSGG
jgi:glycogen synthase